MFSSRLPTSLAANRLTSELARVRAAGRPVLDLTVTNPTSVGLVPDVSALAPLASAEGLAYRPDPFGLPSAREAVAGWIARARGRAPDVRRIALTASTSEAYSVLFKLLCDGGDEVLVPQPSYPLFEHLAALDLVRAVAYRLDDHGRWSIDLGSLDAAWTPRTRAVVVVSPNNPTGSYLRAEDLRALADRCASHGAALVADEVFASYPLDPCEDAVRSVVEAAGPDVLVFALDGLSKSCGMPQLKLGWIEMGGPEPIVEAARERLDLVLDTYLSVNTPVQVALPALLRAGLDVSARIHERLRANLAAARRIVGASPSCSLPRVEGGWSAVVRVPAVASEEALVLRLLADDGVLVHPGFFFDFPREAYLVVSLLPMPADFARGMECVVRRAGIA